MLNQIVLVGKVKEKPIVREASNKVKIANLVLEVDRSYKNAKGEVETDLFNVTLWRNIAEDFSDSCEIGNIIGVKGRLQSNNFLKEDTVYYRSDIIAEKLSILDEN